MRVVRGPHQVVDADDRPVFHRLHVVDVGEKSCRWQYSVGLIVSLWGKAPSRHAAPRGLSA